MTLGTKKLEHFPAATVTPLWACNAELFLKIHSCGIFLIAIKQQAFSITQFAIITPSMPSDYDLPNSDRLASCQKKKNLFSL